MPPPEKVDIFKTFGRLARFFLSCVNVISSHLSNQRWYRGMWSCGLLCPNATAALLAWREESDSWHMLEISVFNTPCGQRRPFCAFLLSIRITFSSEQTFPCGLKGLWNQPEGPRELRQWGRVVSYMCFGKGLEVALYGGDTRGSVSTVRGHYWVSPLWLIPLFRTLGNNHTSPPSRPTIPYSQEKQDIAEQSPIKMGLVYCTIQSPLSPLCLSLSSLPPALSLPSQFFVCVLGQQASG